MVKPKNNFACGECGRLVTGQEKHDYIDCVLYRSRASYVHSDPVNRDLATLRDHILKLEPERDS